MGDIASNLESAKKYDEYVASTIKMNEESDAIGKTIKAEQASFDKVYASLDNEKDVSQIVLDPRDVAELKQEFGKDFSDEDIEKAEKQFCEYDNADSSTHRKLNKHKRDIERENERKKELGIFVERDKSYNYPEHDR